MARYRCNNVACGLMPKGYEFEADKPFCPKCGRGNEIVVTSKGPMRTQLVTQLCDVHLVVEDIKGPIVGKIRQYVACQPKRDYLAAHKFDRFHASGDVRAVTCPSCKGTPAYAAISKWLASVSEEWRQSVLAEEQAKAAQQAT